jgi:plasmid maintenance system killer protein
MDVFELDNTIIKYLNKRNILSQYKKAKLLLKQEQFSSVNFKKRKPLSAGIYYFRLNQKYRALGVFDGQDFIVTEVYDHQ